MSHTGTLLLLHGQGLQAASPVKDGGAYIPVLIINTTLPGIVEAFFLPVTNNSRVVHVHFNT